MLISGSSTTPFVVSVSGGRRALAIFASRAGRPSAVLRYLLPAQATMVAPLARGGPRVRNHGLAIPRLRGSAPPSTRVIVTKRGGNTILRFTVTSRYPVAATYVVIGTRPRRRVLHGVLVLKGRIYRPVSYYSVDLVGDVEKPHRLH